MILQPEFRQQIRILWAGWQFYTDPFLHRDSRTCEIEEIDEENDGDDTTAAKDPTTNKDTLGRLNEIIYTDPFLHTGTDGTSRNQEQELLDFLLTVLKCKIDQQSYELSLTPKF